MKKFTFAANHKTKKTRKKCVSHRDFLKHYKRVANFCYSFHFFFEKYTTLLAKYSELDLSKF